MSKTRATEIVVSELLKRHCRGNAALFPAGDATIRRPIDSARRLLEIRRVWRVSIASSSVSSASRDQLLSVQAPRNGTLPRAARRPALIVDVATTGREFLGHMDDDFNHRRCHRQSVRTLTTLNRFADTQNLDACSADAPTASLSAACGAEELTQILGIFQEPPPSNAAPRTTWSTAS